MKKIISLILLTALILGIAISFSSCKPDESGKGKIPSRGKYISYTYFNTESSITAVGEISDEDFNSYHAQAKELLGYYHKLFDIYYDYSGVTNIRTINQKAGKEPVKVDGALIDFLSYCKELFTLTSGKTNVMMGAVLKIWHDYRSDAIDNPTTAKVPDAQELREAAAHTSIDSLVIDKEAGTVYISDPKASLDVGAVGKGYATERIYERLCEMGADRIVLNIGGNIRTIGLMPDGTKWVTNLTNPDRTSTEFAAKYYLGTTACVTSGNYERYYLVPGDDTVYHHIIDPDTLMPASYFSSVTIITENSALADALSTALFCVSYQEGLDIIKAIDEKIEVIWIDKDFNLTSTKGVEFIK